MTDLSQYDDIRLLSDEQFTNGLKLDDDEYLLQVKPSGAGFMVKMNKDGSVPLAFTNWEHRKRPYYIITERFRTGWQFNGLRHGKSSAWVKLIHPYNFSVEINASAFKDIMSHLTMVKGTIISPCYFQGGLKNAKLKIGDDTSLEYLITLIDAGSEDQEIMATLTNIIEEKYPEKAYNIISKSKK